MSVYIALLRAVNVGGTSAVRMTDLRDTLTDLGLEDVRTLLQSGNVVFRTRAPAEASLERRLEEEVSRRLGVETEFFLRSDREWRGVVNGNPFPSWAKKAPNLLHGLFLKTAPAASAWEAVRGAIQGPDQIEGLGRQGYIVYPEGSGRSRLTPAVLERHLGTRGTSRNWNTIRKLEGMLSGTL